MLHLELKIGRQKFNAILAGLRLLQKYVEGTDSDPWLDAILEDGLRRKSESITSGEINDLCETINFRPTISTAKSIRRLIPE